MKLEENRITDLDIYLHRMQKSILDKMFFLDKVFEPFEYILDFGCANGELIKALHTFFGEYKYIGYDISSEMIAAARRNVPDAEFYTDWNEMKAPFESSLLNISSTVHEVYSYGTKDDISIFWQRVFGSGFKYVTIRDMMLSENDFIPALRSDIELLRKNTKYSGHLKDYEDVWGTITRQNELVHYLLKYSYTQNWQREVRENYVGLTREEFLKLIPKGYHITYFDHYTLPYIAWQVKKDYGIELKTPTHMKVILKKD